MFAFSRGGPFSVSFKVGLAKSFACFGKGAPKTNPFLWQAKNTFARSFFNGFGGYAGNMGCRGNPVDRKYYDLLEVKPDASADDIKKAFRKMAMKHHPDRGGNIEMVLAVAEREA